MSLTLRATQLVLSLVLTFCALAANAAVEIQIYDTATDGDDYVCWAPVHARARLSAPANASTSIQLTSESTPGAGTVMFVADKDQKPHPSDLIAEKTLALTLSGDQGWTGFYILGWRSSKGEKDVRIMARDGTGQVLGQQAVMVRVRKDAESLTTQERDIFLKAIAQLHDLSNGGLATQWNKHARAHADAFQFGIHGTPLFGPWHRAFLLGLERELQRIDPRVAIPYWRFDKPAPHVFHPSFLGRVNDAQTPGAFLVDFDSANPLFGWQVFDGRGGMTRSTNGDSTGPIDVTAFDALLMRFPYSVFNDQLEFAYHNTAHRVIGGWLGSAGSPRDPLFYLLHANVDRAWAHWQLKHGRFNVAGNDGDSYPLLGSYPGPAVVDRARKGSYLQDGMWPWVAGANQGTPDPNDDWPGFSYQFISALPLVGPVTPPTPGSMLDYLDTAGAGASDGFCYDDMHFNGKDPRTFGN